RAIAFAAVFGSSAPQFSRSALTGRSVASAIVRQFSMMASRLTVALPSVLARPRLVVASASNPIAASSFAVPASQGLGMMKAPGRVCSARSASAFSIWVRIGNLRLVCWPVLVGGETSGLSPISQICYFSMHHQLFAWAKMDSDALLTFLTVHRRGGISSAAKALHRSQPAISRRIALLEQELGVPLFERIAGRTMLSDAGRVMVPYAERAVAAAQDAENAVRALARPSSGPIALAVVGTLAGGRLSAILKRFAAEHPEVELSLRTATSAEVSDLIRRGEATIGLRYDRDRSRDLDCELLFAERLQVVCAPDHPRAGRRVAKLAELRGERWIAFPVVPGRREITASHVFALFQT